MRYLLALAAFLFVLLFTGCAAVHETPDEAVDCGRAFAPLRAYCPGYAPDLCRTCPEAEDAFYEAAERLGCGCPAFDCGAWWPFHATPEVYESALSCADLDAMMHDPRPWTER